MNNFFSYNLKIKNYIKQMGISPICNCEQNNDLENKKKVIKVNTEEEKNEKEEKEENEERKEENNINQNLKKKKKLQKM